MNVFVPEELDTTNVHKLLSKHIAVFERAVTPCGREMHHLRFHEPGNCFYAQHFHIHGNFMTTYGDMFEAIYSWSSDISWRSVAGCGLSYFTEKCRASNSTDSGSIGHEWKPEVAVRHIKDYLREHFVDEDETLTDEQLDDAGLDKLLEPHGLSLSEISGEAETGYDFAQLLSSNEEVFGADSWEMYSYGSCPSIPVRFHLLFLKYAMQMVRGEKYITLVPDSVDPNSAESQAVLYTSDMDIVANMSPYSTIAKWHRGTRPQWLFA